MNIYLCGGIQDLSTAEQTEWRNIATTRLGHLFGIFNPMRRNFRDTELESRNEIVNLDKKDIIDSDILLVNATKPSWGTAMEILFANEHNKIVIAFTGKNYKYTSPWVAYHCTRIVKNLDQAIEYINEQL